MRVRRWVWLDWGAEGILVGTSRGLGDGLTGTGCGGDWRGCVLYRDAVQS